ncbi:hypothetical protein [Oryzifoliimicrobium ureilyticus]|uniref:hypothetical protein n=1 Tax=Oryzifoliimicrobium ureilyticus TaxID=3113724 RepID=UPI0030764BA0
MQATYHIAVMFGVVTLACWLAAGLTALVGTSRNLARYEETTGKVALCLNCLGMVSAVGLAATMMVATFT